MSVTTLDNSTAQASASAVLRLLPVPDAVAADALEGLASIGSALPGEGAKAISATIAGASSGSVILVVSAELAAQIENGPVGQQELLAALTPALDDVVASLVPTLGDVRHEAAQSLEADIALSNAATHESVTVIPFTVDGVTVGSLVLLLDGATEVASFADLSASLLGDGALRGVELLSDVEMGVTAELGRTRMTVRELLSLQPGSIVELDRAAGSPVDLLVNGTLVARGEVVVIDEEFGIRITEIVGHDHKKQAN